MNIFNSTFLLRFSIAIILLMHSIPGMFNGGVNAFGLQYLDQVGFAPFGLVLAWFVKISHVVCAVCLLSDRFIKWPIVVTLVVLIVGIFMVHLKDGWFVVGGGRNGIEFNFLLIFALLTVLFPTGIKRLP